MGRLDGWYQAYLPTNLPTTSTIINKILSNQNIIVTDLKLKELLKVKGVEIDLPITTPKIKKLLEYLTGN